MGVTGERSRTCGRDDRKARKMITLGSALDSHIFYAHQQLKRARAEEDFAGIALWMFRIDELLDRRGSPRTGDAQRAPTATAKH